MRYGRHFLIVFMVWVVSVVMVAGVLADSRDVDKKVRSAERMYFNGKHEEADALLKEAEGEAEALKQSGDSAEQQKVKRMEFKMKDLRKKIDRKLDAASKKPKSTQPAAAADAGNKELPSFVVNKFKSVNGTLDIGFNAVEKGYFGSARGTLADVSVQIERMEKSYTKYMGTDHPDMLNLKKRYKELESAIAQGEAAESEKKAAQEKATADAKAVSDKWIARLKPYATGLGQPGHDPEKYFIGSYTAEKNEMAKRSRIYGEVRTVMADYRKSGPGDNATEALQSMVRDLEYNIKTFNESCSRMAEMYIKEADEKMAFLKKRSDEEIKKIGTSEMPARITDFVLNDFTRSLDFATGLLGEDESRVVRLRKDYDDILAKNAKIAEARVAETRMISDKFSGKEKSDVKQKAEEILKAKYPGIKTLRTTVINDDWKEESVVEWTDTTRSALRHRVTRSLTAQVAGKLDGKTSIYTIYIGKDRRTDGSWSPLKGHVMFIDPILEKNVNK